jgi:hypothetical protein
MGSPWQSSIWWIAGIGAMGCDVQLSPLSNTLPDATTLDAMNAPLGPWMMIVPVGPAAVPNRAEDDASMSPNELEITFAIAANNNKQLYSAKRASAGAAWSGAVALAFHVVGAIDQTPRYASDGLTLYFSSTRPGSVGQAGNENIWKVIRTASDADWGSPQPMDEVNSNARERWFAPCNDGRFLLSTDRGTPNDLDLYEGSLNSGLAPTRIDALNTLSNEIGAFLTSDCNQVLFSNPAGGTLDLYIAHRIAAIWGNPTPIMEVNTALGNEQDPWMSTDGKRLLFVSDSSGSNDVYQMSRM